MTKSNRININKEILDEIIFLFNSDLSTYPSDRFKRLYENLGWTSFDFAFLKPDDIIVRARINEDNISFNKVSEISYKPQHLNTTYQRASTPKKTMFYGCFIPHNHSEEEFNNALLATLFELFPLKKTSITNKIIKKKVTFGIWKIKKHTRLPVIMNIEDYFSGKAQCNFHESRAWLLIPKKTELDIIKGVTRFLHFFFTKNIQFEYEYLPSALFADYVCSKGASGIYYPGIRSECDTFSVALTPEFVDIGLSLEFAFEARIYTLDDNYLIESEFTAKPSKGKLFYNIGKSDKKFNTEKEISALFDEYKKRRVGSLGAALESGQN